jgi:hypothetical protein
MDVKQLAQQLKGEILGVVHAASDLDISNEARLEQTTQKVVSLFEKYDVAPLALLQETLPKGIAAALKVVVDNPSVDGWQKHVASIAVEWAFTRLYGLRPERMSETEQTAWTQTRAAGL